MARRPRFDPLPAQASTFGGRGPLGYVVFALIVLTMILVFAWRLWSFATATPRMPVIDVQPQVLAPVPQPDLTHAPPLPDEAAIAAQDSEARVELAREPVLPLWAGGSDAFALAWGRAALARDPADDAARGATPLTVGAAELAHGDLRPGIAVRVVGTVAAVGGSDVDAWRRLLLAEPGGQWLEAIARAPLPAADERVAVTGRFLGRDDLPTGDRKAHVPAVIVAAIGPAPDTPPRFVAEPRADDPLFREVDDERLIVEPQPYAALLACVRDEPASATAPSANAAAYALHHDPTSHRGERFSVRGTVLRAWSDEAVARDRPAGISHVTRILLHQRDWSPFTAIAASGSDIQPPPRSYTKDAGVLTLRLYELAIPGDQPPPVPGARITAEGRFLKFLARPAQPDPTHTIKAVSDRVYTIMLVANAWQPLDDRAPLRGWSRGIVVVGSIFMALLVAYTWRQTRDWRRLKQELRAARERRQALHARGGQPPDNRS